MRIKKTRRIIFETREVTRIQITRRLNKPTFIAPLEIKKDPLLIEKPIGFKARWREKLREVWIGNWKFGQIVVRRPIPGDLGCLLKFKFAETIRGLEIQQRN
jgi:hypothetical protein